MANVYATKTGNWSDPTVWNTGALPTSADNVFSNNFTVTIDQNVTVLSIRNTAQAPAVAGGGYSLNGGFTVNANLIGGAVDLLTYASTGTSSINGTITSGSANNTILFNTATGTLNITGDIVNNNAGMVVRVANTGTLNIVGNVYNTTAPYGNCLAIVANATVNITGNVFTSGIAVFTSNSLIYVSSICMLNIVGNVTHVSTNTTASSCISISSSATVIITGIVTGGDLSFGCNAVINNAGSLSIVGSIIPRPSPNGIGPAVQSGSASAINLFSGPFICNNYGYMPFSCFRMHLIPSVSTYFEFRDETTNGALSPGAIAPATRMISPSAASDAPAQSDVRLGTTYALGTQTGTCNVPNPNSVAFGIPVDNTTGTAVLNVSDVWDYPTSSMSTPNSIGARMKNSSTIDTTGAQLAAFNG